jgi:Xaa-Pro aminopeptidase
VEFSRDELERRLTEARRLMDAEGIDCLLISGVENFSYFVGVPTSLYQSRRPWVALLPANGETIGFIKDGIAVTLREHGFLDEVEPYALPVSTELPVRIADHLKRLKVRRVGCELGLEMRLGMPVADLEAIFGRLPDVEFVDAANLIWELRMCKSRPEAERMRRACAITSETRQQVFRNARSGMTEVEIATMWARLMYEAGGERPSFIYINTGDNRDLLPRPDKRLEKGRTLWLDGGVYVGEYTCDFSRSATLGPPSERQRQLHRDAVEVSDMLLAELRPGVHVRDMARIYEREWARRGYSPRNTAGHGMGMLINEPPLIADWDNTVLRPGMTVGIELGGSEPEGMFVWEQLAWITDDGYDLLTPESSDLVVIDA